ncbi:MAG: hypothetical protein MUF43_00860 [Flavobacterium sp.]|nr:hypothetical protein [Flavobacterium sp.]
MKYVIKLCMLFVLLQSFQCENSNDNTTITPEQLEQKKLEILNYIATFSCENANGCNSIAFGSKPCGGPREYLVYPNSINQNTLQVMVNEYNQMDNLYNIQTNAVSDCMAVMPPSAIGCVNGVCTIIN